MVPVILPRMILTEVSAANCLLLVNARAEHRAACTVHERKIKRSFAGQGNTLPRINTQTFRGLNRRACLITTTPLYCICGVCFNFIHQADKCRITFQCINVLEHAAFLPVGGRLRPICAVCSCSCTVPDTVSNESFKVILSSDVQNNEARPLPERESDRQHNNPGPWLDGHLKIDRGRKQEETELMVS